MSEIRCELSERARALFTSRAEGNLSIVSGGGHEQGAGRRERICRRLGLTWLCAGPQVHGSSVQRVRSRLAGGGTPSPLPADGRATCLREVGVMVLSADCVPVLLGSSRAVVALHAGWRGLAAGVVEEGVRALMELDAADGAQPVRARRELAAAIGPCARACCYEVGPEVRALFAPLPRGRTLDLPGIVRERLLAAGVRDVHDPQLCTICDARFFSHRREGAAAGRQAAIAWLR
jgi:purine-nucleoside/S-methyl-5'-thioadenosine phosphorylase / adenosine deaminase